jgi:hypothetical protein
VKTEDEKKEKCEHGEHCGEEKSEEISEDELLQHLKEGGGHIPPAERSSNSETSMICFCAGAHACS